MNRCKQKTAACALRTKICVRNATY